MHKNSKSAAVQRFSIVMGSGTNQELATALVDGQFSLTGRLI
jgi:hypothetical protein